MENRPPNLFYIDCTTTYFDPRNDGISRVTRMLIEHADIAREAGYGEVHPIVFCHDRYYILPTCTIFKDSPFEKAEVLREIPKSKTWYWKKFLSIVSPTRKKRRAYRQELKPVALNQYEKLESIFSGTLRPLEEACLSGNDFLVLPELCQEIQFPQLLELKKKLKLASIIHDLIPITHPEYCENSIRFNRHFKFTAKQADVVVAVSMFSAACFQAYEKVLELGEESLSKKRIAWFHLGCDLDGDPSPHRPAAEMSKVFADNVPVFLVCGTIEPRKNHLLVLKTFQRLWRQGHEIKLLFVGRYGWNSEETLQEMTGHPELNKRFFWLSQCSDADLGHAYRHCYAVIFPSRVEGFGLPLVEALAAGRQVIFSRIKSFQEIVPEEFLINSFDPDKSEELLDLVLETLRTNKRLDLDKFKPISWRQGVEEFYRILAESATEAAASLAKTKADP